MIIEQSTFKEIPDVFGIVIMGCDISSEEYRNGFIDGVTKFLIEKEVIGKDSKPEDVWKNIYSTTTTGGRTDLIFIGHSDKFNIMRFAMVRLSMPDCSWIEDWLVNYADHYGCAPRGEHAAAFNAVNTNRFDEDD